MSRPGVSYLDVAEAATKLLEQDIRPTIEEVRKILQTGSNSTINRHLREWREKQGNQAQLEKGLPESLLSAVKGIYKLIQESAENKIDQIQSEAKEEINDLKLKLSEISKHNGSVF